jgi:uncharacterized membrane protein
MSKALLLTLSVIIVFVLLLSGVGALLGAVPLDTLAIVAVMLLVFGGGWWWPWLL